MFKWLLSLKPEQGVVMLLVLALHGAVVFALWRYRVVPSPDTAPVVMVRLIHSPVLVPANLVQRVPSASNAPKRFRHRVPPSPRSQQLMAQAAVPAPADAQALPASSPMSPAPSVPTEAAPTPQPVLMSGELAVACPERLQPDYPMASKRLNEQGEVVLRVELAETGQITDARVKTSSGYGRLDAAALKAIKTWHCKPALRNGVAVHAVALQPFDFILGK